MSRDLYFVNRDPNLHLRDAQHAHQLYTQNSFELAPKTKFLYHVSFVLTEEARGVALNSDSFAKVISVLAKSADLPSYRASVETKNQYNRKKNIQTRVDYNEVAIRFHDDNVGLTRTMLEEYYKYNVVEGRRLNIREIGARDKYDIVRRAGIDNQRDFPFFEYIKLYQLSRQKWFSYTLINPLITQWSHDSVDSSDGAGIMENAISVAYEAVFYDNGDIKENSEPAGFSDEETRYDKTPSPLEVGSPDGIPGGNSLPPGIQLIDSNRIPSKPNQQPNINFFSLRGSGGQEFVSVPQLPGAIPRTQIPKTNTQTTSVLATSLDRSIQSLDSDTITRELNRNPSALTSLTKRVLATGTFSSEWNNRNFDRFLLLTQAEQNAIKNTILDKVRTERKVQQIASQVLNAIKGR